MTEILAPCGGEEHLPAALNTGADAVYLGVTAFSARRNARNFTFEQLSEAVRECRISGVRVYVTLNTLVFDDEMKELACAAERIAETGADGVIVQDLGAAKVIHEAAPELRLHASTQMTVTSPSGAEFARKHGFTRVVLARELSRDEIADIIARVDIETEVFVHGALCVCTSGQCLMSAMYGGRSGNRGLCAQPCRLPYGFDGKADGHPLSLKDMSLAEHLHELQEMGVACLKLEGRMKRPEYVYTVTNVYARALREGREPTAEELRRMGLEDVRAENGRVRFRGNGLACAKANLRLRTGERVLLRLGAFPAGDFDQLFEGVKALPFPDYIPRDGQFPVKGYCLNSALNSVPACQRAIKKAASIALGRAYGVERLPETGALYQIQFALVKDRAEIYLDTTGAPLFKRGYRPGHVAAPLRETLAAGLVGFARYRGRDAFWDPFCGSGTIPIEAALIARNRAPGLDRSFAAQQWAFIPSAAWRDAAEEARSLEYRGHYHIFASDIDPKAVALSRENARRAGVEGDIVFSVADARNAPAPAERGVIVCNPPYGERMLEQHEARDLYRDFGRAAGRTPDWKTFVISSDPAFEQCFGREADKKRKLYNGMLQCNLYMYFG